MLRHSAALALIVLLALGACRGAAAEPGDLPDGSDLPDLLAEADRLAAAVMPKVIAWRRDLHQHPELSNREFRTAALVAKELERLGLEVRTEVAHTGVVGVLRGARSEPVVALRADMDALPVTEELDLPFASKLRSTYLGRDVGVMHACGHDAHTALLLGVAELLAGLRERLPGSVVFLFQPAEEGTPPGEEGGARLMIAEGALENPAPQAVFGLHVVPQFTVGTIGYRSGGAMASSDRLRIVVRGQQTHAAYPWLGVDPIAVAARIVTALHAIPARQMDVRVPSVVSIGAIHGGVRNNIIPEEVELLGTIRALDPQARRELHRRVRKTAEMIAESAGARAEVEVRDGYPVTVNDPALTRRMVPTLERVAPRVLEALPRTGAEDFSFYAQRIPGLYIWLGVRSPEVAPEDAAPNHSPRFFVDEGALPLGVRALAHLALDYLAAGP
ncbi:MAG: amidohydrolase [Deltaproteobacteria bacterium]|nr:amidohydrolase [Deltaproteobacteria bacterium]